MPLDKGTTRAVYADAVVVDGVPCYQIRTGGGEVVHYLRKAHATFTPADLDEKTRVTLQIGAKVAYTTEA